MDPSAEPPSHDETTIESSIVEIPSAWKEPTPRPPLRRGPILLSLLLAVVSLTVGGVVLYQRRAREAEDAFLARCEWVLSEEQDPAAVLAEAEDFPQAFRERVAVQSLLERLQERATRRAGEASALAKLSMSPGDATFAERASRLSEAAASDPESRLIRALRAHLQLEVWRNEKATPTAQAWRTLLKGLRSSPPSAVALVAKARVRLAQSSASVTKARALQDLADAAQASGGAGEAGWAIYAAAWRAVLLLNPREALVKLDELLSQPSLDDRPALMALAFELRARVWWTLNDLAKAAADAKEASRRDRLAEGPATFSLWIQSEVRLRAGEPATPGELQSARDLTLRWPRSGLALAAWAQFEGEAGLATARRAVGVERNSDLTHLALARRLQASGEIQAAEKHARQAVLWGRSLAAYMLRAELHIARGRIAEARRDLAAAQEISPSDGRLTLLRGQTALLADDPKSARRLAEQLLARAPESADAHALLAGALGDLGLWKESIQSAGKALGLDGTNSEARLARAQAFFGKSRQSVLALADLRELDPGVLKAGPLAVEAAYLRARCHQELGETPEALASYERFLSLARSGDRRRPLATRYVKENREP